MTSEENICIKVNYYNEEEASKFQSSPTSADIDKVAGNTITVSKSELLTYLLFPIVKDVSPHSTYNEIKSRIQYHIGSIDELLDFSRGTVNSKYPTGYTDMTNRLGVAIGLCVCNSIHGTTEADWYRIPEIVGRGRAKKTLDYRLGIPDNSASTGEYFVHMEAKGSIQSTTDKKTSSISQHKSDILQKKSVQRSPNYKDVYYGTIAVVNQENTAQCWLVDPPSPEQMFEPRKHRLLARMYYFWSQMSLISPAATLNTVLINRIRDLTAVNDYENFDQLFLLNRNGEKTSISPSFFTSRSNIRGLGVVGKLIPLNNNRLLFVGLDPDIYDLVINQNFDDIISYKTIAHSGSHRVSCVVRRTDRQLYSHILRSPIGELVQSLQSRRRGSDTSRIEFNMMGKFYFSSSGRIFGVLPLDQTHLF